MTSDVRMTYFPAAWDRIARSDEVHGWLGDTTEKIADDLRRSAPVRSGAGRNSIRNDVRMGSEGWYGTATWDDAHYYMGIQNSRTHWAEPAVQRVRYV